jgi:hypothetical protein
MYLIITIQESIAFDENKYTPYQIRIFDASDHLRQCNVKKDHLWKYLSKETP